MKYEVTYMCGHKGTVDFCGKNSERQWRLKKKEQDVCPECMAEQLKIEASKISEQDELEGLPNLTGSEKQVAWATQIRRKQIDLIDKLMEEVIPATKEQDKENLDQVLQCMDLLRKEEDSASFWIEHRFMTPMDFLKYAFSTYKNRIQDLEIRQVVEEERMECETLKPENIKTNIVTEILVSGSDVIVSHPERNEEFSKMMKKWKFSFSITFPKGWKKSFSYDMNISLENYAADIATRIIAEGYIVRIQNDNIRNMVKNQNFISERKRIVTELNGKFAFSWIGSDWYDEIKRLPKAKWERPFVLIPVEYYNEVIDFAKANNFFVTESALNLKKSYVNEFESAPVVIPQKEAEEVQKLNSKQIPPQLKVEKTEIEKELKDE